jgi:hypothetical protein
MAQIHTIYCLMYCWLDCCSVYGREQLAEVLYQYQYHNEVGGYWQCESNLASGVVVLLVRDGRPGTEDDCYTLCHSAMTV